MYAQKLIIAGHSRAKSPKTPIIPKHAFNFKSRANSLTPKKLLKEADTRIYLCINFKHFLPVRLLKFYLDV